MNKYIIKKLGELPIHQLLQHSSLNDSLWGFDAVSLYPSAISDEKPISLRIETRYAFTPDLNDELVNKFNEGMFTHASAFLKTKENNPKNLIVQHLPVEERVKRTEINHMFKGYIVDFTTSVDRQEIGMIGGKVKES